jgi:hypothetical protein
MYHYVVRAAHYIPLNNKQASDCGRAVMGIDFRFMHPFDAILVNRDRIPFICPSPLLLHQKHASFQ